MPHILKDTIYPIWLNLEQFSKEYLDLCVQIMYSCHILDVYLKNGVSFVSFYL